VQRPDFLFTMITETSTKEPVQRYIDKLAENFPNCQILVSGYQVVAQAVNPPVNVSILRSLDHTLAFLDEMRQPAMRAQ
jgi:hypothetical protein